MFKVGISKVGDLIDLGVEMGILRKSGANYSYNETRLGQGRENAKTFLINNPEIADQIEAKVRGIDAANGHSEAPVPEAELQAAAPVTG